MHARLCRTYGCPIAYFHDLDPLSELVSSLLSHRTTNRASGLAFRRLRERYGSDWQSLLDAPVADIEALIAGVTWPDQKARSLRRVLGEVRRRQNGSLALDWLATADIPVARLWLESLPGVGPKTSAAVLSFSHLRRKALPVDSHHFRVAVRVGLLAPRASLEAAHRRLEDLLPEDWDAQAVYDDHEVFMLHGQRCCHFQDPACHRCPVLDLCPCGQARQATASAPPPREQAS